MSNKERGGFLVGAGAGLMLIMLLVLQSIVGINLINTRTATSATTTIPDGQQVAGANAIHLLLLESRNVSGLVSGFGGNATLLWIGGPNPVNTSSLPALHGYRLAAIDIVLKDFTGLFYNFSLSNESQTIRANGSIWVADSKFNFYGWNPGDGRIYGAVVGQDSYVRVGDSWLIASETWNFTTYHVQNYVNAGF